MSFRCCWPPELQRRGLAGLPFRVQLTAGNAAAKPPALTGFPLALRPVLLGRG
ncbi:MAG: hypothetical protein WKG07_48235 [Hymenobacter sp.]